MRKTILLFGYFPPPVFGPSVAYQSLMKSSFPSHFDVITINLSLVKSISDLHHVQLGKLLKITKVLLQEIFVILTKRIDYCCYPLAFNRNAFFKDLILTGIAYLFRVRVILYAHGTGLQQFRVTLNRVLRHLFERMIKKTSGIIVLTKGLRSDFKDLVPNERIFAASLGIEPHEGPNNSTTVSHQINVVYLGALIEAKGVLNLLRAMKIVIRQRSDIQLILAGAWGTAEFERDANRLINESKIGKAVKFVGVVTGQTKWELLNVADIFVFPPISKKEAFGIVMLEAMQAGLPIVATRGGARSEVIKDQINGLLVEEGNAEDLAKKILCLANNPVLRKEIGRRNKQEYYNQYTHDQYGMRMVKIFEEIATLDIIPGKK